MLGLARDMLGRLIGWPFLAVCSCCCHGGEIQWHMQLAAGKCSQLKFVQYMYKERDKWKTSTSISGDSTQILIDWIWQEMIRQRVTESFYN